MSSRSKEKALNAIRKLFKGNSSSNNNNNNNNSNNNSSTNGNGNGSSSTSNGNNNSTANNNSNNNNNNNNNNGDKLTTTNTAAGEASAAAAMASMANDANAAAAATGTAMAMGATSTAAGGAAGAAAIVPTNDSPSKRMRRQDNKVSPATRMPMPGAAQHPPDFSIRARRLMKEYKEIQKIQSSKREAVFTVELINDSLYEWHARLHIIDPDSKLAKDMVELNIPFILLHLVFPDNFPFAPPFMRVVEPRIEKGFVMEGGAICMELLTPRGWASAYTVEAVLMQFAASLVKGQGRIVRKSKSSKEFSKRSAEEAFRSLVKTHEKYGWVTPALSDG